MTVRPAVVVLGWFAANVVLIAVLFGFGESLVGELLYACSSVPLLLFALAVGWGNRGEGEVGEQIPVPSGTGYSAIAAVGSLLIGIGVVFAYWIAIVGALLAGWAGMRLWRTRPRTSVLEEHRA
jgi:hypothetical protein